MRRSWVAVSMVAAVLAVSVSAAAGSSTPKNLTASTAKGPLVAGQEVKGVSTNLTFVTAAGNLECSSNVIVGTEKTNGAKTIEGTITEESSTGEEPGHKCKTTTPLGAAEIKATGFPWPTKFSYKGVNEVKGTKKVSFTSVFSGGVTCTFEASKVKSTFTIGGPARIHTNNQVFKTSKTSNPACPKEGKLSGEWTLTSDGETVESELT
jgi:hypothetical protein